MRHPNIRSCLCKPAASRRREESKICGYGVGEFNQFIFPLCFQKWTSTSIVRYGIVRQTSLSDERRLHFPMLAPLRHADHVEQCPSSEAKRKNLLSLRLSQFDRCCRKSRKSNDAKNLANVDFWTTPPLRCSLVSIRRSVVVFLRSDVVPHVAAHETHQQL